MTANAFAEDRKRAVDIGMNGHIAKPIDIEKTEKVIHLVLNKQKNEKRSRNGRKMKGKRMIAGILLAGILAVTLAGCKTQITRKKKSKSLLLPSAATVIPHTII